ncbi:helix-turn-helix transcriptional regulator, partial [Blastococcus saxobsidens]
MPRVADPAVRTALVEAAAEMLAGRLPVTARSLADRAGTSTTALYTHFGGMPGLWRAVRQEGFTRLAAR